MQPSYLVVASAEDPVSSRLLERWGTPDATGWAVDGVPIRRLSEHALLLRRRSLHIHDERMDLHLPAALRDGRVTLVFPSIHRSEQNVKCFAVHPLGNPGLTAEVGGRPRTLVPTDPRRMAAVLRRLHERGAEADLRTTYEATHHGPELGLPAFFVEVGYGTDSSPPEDAVRILAEVIPEIIPDPDDHVALGVGGGHYAPHFTDLALRRRWAFGHLLSRHVLGALDAATAWAALDASPEARGILYSRAEDAKLPVFERLAPRLRDNDAPKRAAESGVTGASRSASGT
jgi:D-aminoacyl-tRNA deacylase